MIALGDSDRVQVVAVTPGGTKTVRDVALPSYLVELQWVLADPIVLLGRPDPDRCMMPEEYYKSHADFVEAERGCAFDPAQDGVIGRITARGFVAYPKLPESTWAALKQPGEHHTACAFRCWQLAIRDTAIYQGHCIAAFSADGMEICDDWMYARVDVPGPAMAKLPKSPPPSPSPAPQARSKAKPFEVRPSPHVTIEFVAQEEEARYGGRLTQLRCTQGPQTTLYPGTDLDLGMGETVEWLTTDPPRFLAFHGHDGMTGSIENVMFEGCTPREIGRVVQGPDDMQIVDGMLLRHGKVLGHVPGARLVDFSP